MSNTSAAVQALGWTLVHFLWQGLFIAALLGAANALLRRASAPSRYLAACAAMALMPVAALLTFVVLNGRAGDVAPGVPGRMAADLAWRGGWLAWVVGLWLAGVVVLAAWSGGGWLLAQRLKRSGTSSVPHALQQTLHRLSERLAIKRAVALQQSVLAKVPMVVGWLRPVILLPASALANLSMAELEALMAHELAHVRRHDYLVNLFATCVETLLYYHPAVWWVGGRIREEREHCCDDLAVAACGDPLVLARALTGMEELRGPQLAMAAGGGSLGGRVRRMLGMSATERLRPPAWLVVTVLLGLVALAGAAMQPAPRGSEVKEPKSLGYIGRLFDAGYTNLSADDIIRLKTSGISPEYAKGIREAGFGVPNPEQLISLHHHGLSPEYVKGMREAGVLELDFSVLMQMKRQGVTPRDLQNAQKLKKLTPEQILKLKRAGALE